MLELRRRYLFRRLAQREAWHMGFLRRVSDPLLGFAAAPFTHQRVQDIPVGYTIRLAGEAWLPAHAGAPITSSQAAHCFSSRGEMAT